MGLDYELDSNWSPPVRAGLCATNTIANNILPFSECASPRAKKPTGRSKDRIAAFHVLLDDAPTRKQTKIPAARPGRERSKTLLHRKRVLWAGVDSLQRNQDCKAPAIPDL
jgi:hypothetical protein